MKQKSYSNKIKENNHHFPPKIITFVCISCPRYPPPHSLSSVTWLPTLVTQFRCLPLTAFPFKAVCLQPLLLVTSGLLNVCWQFKCKMEGTELPAIDASSRSLCCTDNVQLQDRPDHLICCLTSCPIFPVPYFLFCFHHYLRNMVYM
jgi:hypothetical protein